ncbi:hypothetical protein LC593_12180 [Nostoc sp. CHAB 5844]|nr:hypothetical protein [Nostoc sp. CHAB 5844]
MLSAITRIFGRALSLVFPKLQKIALLPNAGVRCAIAIYSRRQEVKILLFLAFKFLNCPNLCDYRYLLSILTGDRLSVYNLNESDRPGNMIIPPQNKNVLV